MRSRLGLSLLMLGSSLLSSPGASAETPFEQYYDAAVQANKQRDHDVFQSNLILALQESQQVDLRDPENKEMYTNLRQAIGRACTWYTTQGGMEDKCEQLYRLRLASDEKLYGASSPELLEVLGKLGSETGDLRKFADSEKFYRRGTAIAEQCSAADVERFGLIIPAMFEGYQGVLRQQGRTQEADEVKARFRRQRFDKIRRPGY